MVYTEEHLRDTFWNGVNTNIPQDVKDKGPIAVIRFTDNEYRIWFEGKFQTESELNAFN